MIQWSNEVRFTVYLLALFPFLALFSCQAITAALRGAGVPLGGSEIDQAAADVDVAIKGWLDSVFWWGTGVGTSEGTRGCIKLHRARKARKAQVASKPHLQ
jgi:hypothetical protein